jgi:hypothetical protein
MGVTRSVGDLNASGGVIELEIARCVAVDTTRLLRLLNYVKMKCSRCECISLMGSVILEVCTHTRKPEIHKRK